MNAILMGYKYLDFSSKDGPVKGHKLFLSYSDPDVKGQATDDIFIRADSGVLNIDPEKFLGKEIKLDTNLKGKVSAVYA